VPASADAQDERIVAMNRLRSPKPLIGTLLALLFVVALVAPFLSTDFFYSYPGSPWDLVQAGAFHWSIVIAVALLWFGIQLFWKAPTEATKLGLAASATIVWIAMVLFFPFNPPGGNFDEAGIGGAAAFFALVGGLGVVLVWTRFLSDELTF
jgi:hypothetical protein